MSRLGACEYCGRELPVFALGRHYETCSETPGGQSEQALLDAWIAACKADPDGRTSADLSGAALAAIDDAVDAYEADPDIGGVTLDALEAHMSELSASDFEYLSLFGAKLLQDGPTLPPDESAGYRRSPNLTEVTIALMKLVAEELGIETAFDGISLAGEGALTKRSAAFQAAFDEASERWGSADDDDKFQPIWSVASATEWTGAFTEDDWEHLTRAGAGQPVPVEMSERYKASPLLILAALGLERLVVQDHARWKQGLLDDWEATLANATAQRDRERDAIAAESLIEKPPKKRGWTMRPSPECRSSPTRRRRG
jgi:hypothetical protein